MVHCLRSDSNRAQSFHGDAAGDVGFQSHAVEPWSRTAQLPPVMVSHCQCLCNPPEVPKGPWVSTLANSSLTFPPGEED